MNGGLYVCSSNAGKLADFALGLTDFRLEPLPDLRSIPPPEESGKTFEENARLKAVFYSKFTTRPVLADDSGLEVFALNGSPGVYSARYAGLGATDGENNRLLLENLKNTQDRRARYVCVLAVAEAGRILYTAEGIVDGALLFQCRGQGGFGYDPLFFFPALGRTFAEMTGEERFVVSHRGDALRRLADLLPSRT